MESFLLLEVKELFIGKKRFWQGKLFVDLSDSLV